MSTHGPARQKRQPGSCGLLRPAARSTVKNGSRTTLIARKLAATTSVFVSPWELGQILLIPGVLVLAVMSVVGLPFPKANTPGRSRLLRPSDDGESVGEVAKSLPVGSAIGADPSERP